MRLFVAVDVPDKLRDAVESEIVDPLRDRIPDARWTRPEGRHLTLKFLGNVEEERVGAIGDAVRNATATQAPFVASFADVGGFPNAGRPRVLWIGIGQGSEEMSALAGAVESALEQLGFVPEGRPFRGHLTLARFPRPKRIAMPEIAVQLDPFPVQQVTLFESRLHPKGARYTALEHFAMRG